MSTTALPAQLVGRYQLYKRRTELLIGTVVALAKTCSEDAKKLATNGGVHRTKDLLQLADFIELALPAPKVEITLLNLAREVIRDRMSCADWYAAKSSPTVQEQNQAHRHFIQLLENVLAKLQTAYGNHKASTTTAVTRSHDLEADTGEDLLSNAFAGLQVDDPSDDALGTAVPASAVSTSVLHLVDNLEPDQQTENEVEFWCYLQDLQDIRAFVRQAWVDWQKGEISFVIASKIANVAVNLMRKANVQFMDKYGDDVALYHTFLGVLGLQLGYDGEAARPYIETERGPIEDPLILDLLCPDAAHMMMTFKTEFDKVALNQLFFISGEPARFSDDEVTAKCSYHPFAGGLMKLIPELVAMNLLDVRTHTGDDIFVKALRRMHKTIGISTFLVSAGKMYMDISEIVGTATHIGAHLFGRAVSASSYTLADCMETRRVQERSFTKDEHFDILRAECDTDFEMLDALRTPPSRTMEDSSQQKCREMNFDSEESLVFLKDEEASEDGTLRIPDWVPRQMVVNLPVLAGNLLYRHKLKMQYLSVSVGPQYKGVVNDNHVVLSLAHLYRAARYYGLITVEWPDMEWFIRLHSTDKKPYVLEVQQNAPLSTWDNHLMLALEFTASEISNTNRRQQTNYLQTVQRSHARFAESASELTRSLLDQYGRDNDADVEREFTLEVVLEQLAERSKATSGRIQTADFTGLQLLGTLRHTLINDEEELNFDYIGFWVQCSQLLRILDSTFYAKLEPQKAPHGPYMDSLVVRELLQEVAVVAGSKWNLMKTKFALATRGYLLPLINKEGDKFINAARQQGNTGATATTTQQTPVTQSATTPDIEGTDEQDPESQHGTDATSAARIQSAKEDAGGVGGENKSKKKKKRKGQKAEA